MRIHLVALALATFDAFVLFAIRQAAVIDTSVYIALIAGVVGLLTLVIQTYAQIRMAKITKLATEIKEKQEVQQKAGEERSRKIEAQGVQLVDAATKLQEVHTVVNSGQSRLIEQVNQLTAQLAELKGSVAERVRADAKMDNRAFGASEERQRQTPPPAAPAAPPAKVEVINQDPLNVNVTNPTGPKE